MIGNRYTASEYSNGAVTRLRAGLSLLFMLASTTAHSQSCREALFTSAIQTHGSGSSVDLVYNAGLTNSPSVTLQTTSITTNSGSSVLSCSAQHCVASGTPADPIALLPFETSSSTEAVTVGYQGSATLGDDGSREFGAITTNSESALSLAGNGVDEPVYHIDSLSLGYRSTLTLVPGTYWIRSLTLGGEASINTLGEGTARVYVGQDFALSYQSTINGPHADGSREANRLGLVVYGALTSNSQVDVSAIAYASGPMQLNSSASASGAFVANGFTLGANANVAFEAPQLSSDLGQICPDDTGGGANVAPTATDLSIDVLEDASASIELMANDANGDALTFQVATSPAFGNLSGAAPFLVYTPEPGFTGIDEFTFTASDGDLQSNTATVTISVGSEAGSCRASVFANAVQTFGSGSSVDFQYNAGLTSNPSATLQTGNVTTNSGSSVLSCGSEHCAASGTPVDPLVLLPFEVSGSSDSVIVPYQGDVSLGGDGAREFGAIGTNSQSSLSLIGDGVDEPTYRIDSLSLGYKSTLTLVPGTYWIRSLTMGSEAAINTVGGGTAKVYVGQDLSLSYRSTINGAHADGSRSANRLGLVVYGALTTNTESDISAIAYASGSIQLASSAQAEGAFTASGVTLGASGSVAFEAPLSTSDLGQICPDDTGEAENAVPVITSTPVTSVNQGESYSYAMAASDADQDALTYSLTTAPTGMAISAAGVISWEPTEPGLFDVTVQVDDLNGGVVTQTFQVTVVEVIINSDPVFTSTPVTAANEGMPYEYAVVAPDPDQDALTYSLLSSPLGMAIDAAGLITWTPDAPGVFDVTVQVDDSNGGVVTQAYQIDVEAAPPSGPMINPIEDISALVGEELTISVVAVDAQGGDVTLSVRPIPLPEGLTVNVAEGELRWTLSADNIGDTEVTVIASSDGSTVEETFTVSVAQPDPSAPTGVSGRVYDATAGANGEDLPLVGAIVELAGTGLSATTDSGGNFLLSGDITGGQLLTINGGTAQLAPDGATYANFQEQISLPPRIITAIDRPFFMPRINAGSVTPIEGVSLITVANTDIGASIQVRAGRVLNPDGSRFTGTMSISEVPKNLAPVALPDFLDPALLITVQPAGLTFTLNPVPLTFPNLDEFPPGTLLDLWAVDPARGVFAIVGQGEVSADGQTIQTVEGGLRNSTWGTFSPTPDMTVPSPDTKTENTTPKKEKKEKSGSSVVIGTGVLQTEFMLPAYRSQGQSRQMEFVYRSVRAHPQEIFSVDTVITTFNPIPRRWSYELEVDGLTQNSKGFVDPTTDEGLVRRARVNIPFDLSAHSTGIYDYEVRARSFYRFSSTQDTFGSQITVVNESGSPFGAGWGLRNLKRIYQNETGRILLVNGNGSEQIFNQQRPIVIGSYSASRARQASDGSFNFSFVDGDLFSDFKGDLLDTSLFGAEGTIARTVSFRAGIDEITLESLEGLDIFVLTGEAVGQGLSFGERAVLEQFVQEGGALLELAAEPRSEPLLGTELELVSSPGNTLNSFFASDAADHPVNDGPFGRAGILRSGTNASFYSVVGAGSELAARSGSPVLMDVPIGTEGAAGAAVLSGDDSIAISNHPTSGVTNRYTSSNRTVMLNTIAYLSGVPGFRVDSDLGGEEFFGPVGDYSELVRLPDGTFQQTMKDGMTYLYDADGFQTSMVDRNNNMTTYAYSADGLLELMTDPKGLETSFGYVGGKLQTVTDPAGRVSSFNVDQNGDLQTITFPDGATKNFGYDENHLMVQETDERGFVTTREYNQFGIFESSVLPDGAVRSYTPSKTVNLGSDSTDPASAVPSDKASASFTDGENRTKKMKTDRLGRLTSFVDDEGRSWVVDRDVNGNQLRTLHPNGLLRESTYDVRGNKLTVSNSVDSGVTTMTYDEFSMLTSVEDELGELTIIERDGSGNPVLVTNPLGHENVMSWDVEGRLAGGLSPNGVQVTIAYNDVGLAESVVSQPSEGLARSVTYEYDDAGNVSSTILSSGLETTFEYDDMGRVTSSEDTLGRAYAYSYNEAGGTISSSVSDGTTLQSSVSYDYDPLGRRTVTRQPHEVGFSEFTTSYDLAGNEISITDATGDATIFGYDSANRLTSVLYSDGGLSRTEISIDDKPLMIAAPNGAETTYEYDLLGRNLSETSPDRGTTSFSYDLRGRVVGVTDARGISSIFEYDAVARITSKVYPSPEERVSYVYDSCTNGVGLLCARTDEAGSYAWEYDGFGNVTVSGSSIGGVEREIEYSYNSLDGIVEMTLPSGRVVTYSRDSANRVTSIMAEVNGVAVPVISSIEYRADNLPTELVYGNSVVESKVYDVQGRLSSWNIGSLRNSTMQYDADTNLIAINGGLLSSEYGYDSLDRLTKDSSVSGLVNDTFSYDISGNRLSSFDGSEVTTYGYSESSNRLLGINGDPVTLDSSGNLITDEKGRVYSYNEANRLESVFNPANGITSEYVHNGAGLRAQKTRGSSTVVYSYDTNGNLVSESDAFGEVIREYIWIDDTPVAQIDRSGDIDRLTFIHVDHLLTPRFATGLSGEIAWSWQSGAFGAELPNEDPENTGISTIINLRFTGQYFDVDTGLHYNYFRSYDPTTGRYTQSDPIGLNGGINTYSYVGSNPLAYVDPFGLHKGDKLFGLPKKFWNWYHKSGDGKQPGDPDLPDRDSAKSFFDEWERLGKPGPDAKRNRKDRGAADPGLLEWLVPWQLIPFLPTPLACGELDCDGNGEIDALEDPSYCAEFPDAPICMPDPPICPE